MLSDEQPPPSLVVPDKAMGMRDAIAAIVDSFMLSSLKLKARIGRLKVLLLIAILSAQTASFHLDYILAQQTAISGHVLEFIRYKRTAYLCQRNMK